MGNKEIKVFTAFSGYDSQCLALEKLGVEYDLIGWSEIDKSAIRAHNLLFPQYKDRNYGNISKIDWSQVPDFDLFTYSSPCQDFSNAGLQRGGEEGSNTRSSLLWECRKAILAKKPKYLLLENVEALINKKFINLFNKWISELGEYGYTSYWQVLNAKNYGIPQSRNRVFLVSVLREDNDKFPIYHFPQKIELKTKLINLLEDNVDVKYYLSKETIEKFLYIDKDNKVFYKDKEVRPNETFYWNTTLKFANNSTKGGVSTCLKTDNAVAILECKPLKIIEKTKKGYAEAVEGDSVNISRITCHKRRGRVGKGISNTITCACDMGAVIKCECENNGVVGYEYRIRKLTPRECFRLMGVEDKYIDIIQNSGQISENQQYKLAGNSIVVDVLVAIFNKLLVNKENDFGSKSLF